AMSRPPARRPRKPAAPVAKPAATLEQTLERALDPLASVLKQAALIRADRRARPTETAAALEPAAAPPAGKPGLAISPLATPFPEIPPIGGGGLATGRAGFHKPRRHGPPMG